jgi:hypothetical protein
LERKFTLLKSLYQDGIKVRSDNEIFNIETSLLYYNDLIFKPQYTKKTFNMNQVYAFLSLPFPIIFPIIFNLPKQYLIQFIGNSNPLNYLLE